MNMFKTTTAKNADEYIDGLIEPRKSEIEKLHKLITSTVPKLKPFIIAGMIGYGEFHYKSKSGREGEWCTIGLGSQKNYISLYVCAVRDGKYIAETNKAKFPKAKIGKSCVSFKKTDDLDLEELKKLLKEAEKSPGFAGL